MGEWLEMDEQSKELMRRVVRDELSTVARKSDIVGPDTPMPLKLTPKQAWSMLTFMLSMLIATVMGVWWLAQREQTFRSQVMAMQSSFEKRTLELSIELKDQIVTLRQDMNRLMSTLKDRNDKEFDQLKAEVLQLKAKAPTEYPPPVWLRDVYHRDNEIQDEKIRSNADAIKALQKRKDG